MKDEASVVLKEAVRLKFALPEAMTADPDLARTFKNDPEFDQLVQQVAAYKGNSP